MRLEAIAEDGRAATGGVSAGGTPVCKSRKRKQEEKMVRDNEGDEADVASYFNKLINK